MRVSKRFKLGRTQPTLDFVDVDYNGDTALFISPKALAGLPSDWGDTCVSLVHRLALDHTLKAQIPHQPLHGAARDR